MHIGYLKTSTQDFKQKRNCMNNQNILRIDKLEKLIQQKHMLSHSFYQAWSCGALTKATLKAYAKEYYQHVKAFPTYISALHSRCDDPEIRRCLLTNLIDEESGHPNGHSALRRRRYCFRGCRNHTRYSWKFFKFISYLKFL